MDKMSHNEDLLGNTSLKTPWHKSDLRNGHIGSLKLQWVRILDRAGYKLLLLLLF